MVRKIGFGRQDDPESMSVPQENIPTPKNRNLRLKLAKRLIALGLIETVGAAILLRGILSGDLVPMTIGIAWMLLVTLVALRVVLNFARQHKETDPLRKNTTRE